MHLSLHRFSTPVAEYFQTGACWFETRGAFWAKVRVALNFLQVAKVKKWWRLVVECGKGSEIVVFVFRCYSAPLCNVKQMRVVVVAFAEFFFEKKNFFSSKGKITHTRNNLR